MNGKLLKVTFKLFENYTLTFEDTDEKNYGTNALVQYKNSKNEDLLITIVNPDNPNEFIMFYPHSVVAVNVEEGGTPTEMVTITFVDPFGYAEEVPDPVQVPLNYEIRQRDLVVLTTPMPDVTFNGWWDSTFTVKYAAGDKVPFDVEAYANWAYSGNIELIYKNNTSIEAVIPSTRGIIIGVPLTAEDLPEVVPTDPNYEFDGWWDKYYTRKYNVGDVLDQTTFLYVKFKSTSVSRTITFNDRYGYAESIPSPITKNDGEYLMATDCPPLVSTNPLYAFDYWADAHGTQIVLPIIVTSDMELFAEWKRLAAVQYLDEYGYAESLPPTKYFEIPSRFEPHDLPTLVSTNPDYAFAHWEDDFGNVVIAGTVINADMNLHAKWNPTNITITYTDSLDRRVGPLPSPKDVAPGYAITAEDILPLSTSDDYQFDFWKNELGNRVYVGDIVNGNVTFDAVFKNRVRYDDTAGYAEEVPDAKYVNNDYVISDEDLPTLVSTDPRYVFSHWVEGDFGTRVYPGFRVTRRLNLVAVWSDESVEISYTDPTGLAESIPESKSVAKNYEITDADIPELVSTDPTYIFDGWYTSGGIKVEALYVITDNTVLYAHFVEDLVTVSYADTTSNAISMPDEKTILRNNALTIDYLPTDIESRDATKVFAGWFNYEGTDEYEVGDIISDNTVLFAKFVDALKLDYIDENGVSDDTRATKYVAPGYVLTAEDVAPFTTDKAFTFWIWTSQDGSVTYDIGSVIDADTILYANWTPGSVEIRYRDPAGFGGTLPPTKSVSGGYILLAEDIPELSTSSMFTFDGWYDASYSRKYEVGDRIDNPSVEMFAKWSPIPKVRITYVDPGSVADSMPTDHEVYPGHTLEADEVPELTTSIPDIEFYGWYNADNTIHYEEGYEITEDTILYAIFRPSINLIYNDEDGIAVELPSNREVPARHYVNNDDVPFIESNDDTKIFAGWWNEDGSHRYEVEEYMDSAVDVNLYAHWVTKEEINLYYYSKPTAGGLRHLYDKIWYKNAPITDEILEGFEPYYTADGMKHSFIRWENSTSTPYKFGDVLTADTSMYSEEIDEGPFDVVKAHYTSDKSVELPEDFYIERGLSLTESNLIPKVRSFEEGGMRYVFERFMNEYEATYYPGYVVNNDINLKANYIEMPLDNFLVTFIDNERIFGDDPLVRTTNLRDGEPINYAGFPEYNNPDDIHVLAGWAYEDGTLVNRETDIVTRDTVLHPVWNPVPDELLVSYVDFGRAVSVPPQIGYRYRDVINSLPVLEPASPNERFVGWYDATFSVRYEEPFKVINNITMYALFVNTNEVVITYNDYRFNNRVASKVVEIGSPIDASFLPELPSSLYYIYRYTFDFWGDYNGDVTYQVGDTFDSDVTFYAHWIEGDLVNLYYYDFEGLADWIPDAKLNLDSPYTLTSDDLPRLHTSTPGKAFVGWKNNEVMLNVGDVLTESANLEAVWRDGGGPLTFTAVDPGAAVMLEGAGPTTEYSRDGVTWNPYSSSGSGAIIILNNVGDSVMFRAYERTTGQHFLVNDYNRIEASGTIMSLCNNYNKLGFQNEFKGLFENCTSLVTAPELSADIITAHGYDSMFKGCTSLVTAPELPATTLSTSGCYYEMFEGCTSLVNGPSILPAMSLPQACYYMMFEGCTSLVNAPVLPATTIANSCYRNMFKGCTSLVTAPEIHATTVGSSYTFSKMFEGCTSLVNGPSILPATEVKTYCCEGMFHGCTSLVNPPELPATTLANLCYNGMFANCTSLVTAPELPATALQTGCYQTMFTGCTSLVNAPELPATTLVNSCYRGMFSDCTSLVTAPELPATALQYNCYRGMFSDCTMLNYIKCAFTSWHFDAPAWTEDWTSGVSSNGTFVCPTALSGARGTDAIPAGWTIERY